jgi:hypothetical protein
MHNACLWTCIHAEINNKNGKEQSDEVVKKSPKMLPNPFYVKINTQLVSWEKVARYFALLL